MITLLGCPLYWCRLSLSLTLHPSCPVLPTCSGQPPPASVCCSRLDSRERTFLSKPAFSWTLEALIHNRCLSCLSFGSKPLNVRLGDSVGCVADVTNSACLCVSERWAMVYMALTHTKKEDKEEEKICKNLQRFTVHEFIKPQVLNLLLEVQ